MGECDWFIVSAVTIAVPTIEALSGVNPIRLIF
jgi:hypothetical protein